MNDVLIFSLSAFLSACCAVLMMRRRASAECGDDVPQVRLLLAEGRVLDATPSGREYLDSAPEGPTDEIRLRSALSQAFRDGLDAAFAADAPARSRLISQDGLSEVTIDNYTGTRQISLRSCDPLSGAADDAHAVREMRSELQLLRTNTRVAPFLTWRQDKDGQVTWLNRAYLDTVIEIHGEDRARQWPLPALFDTAAVSTPGDVRRLALHLGDGCALRWFECTANQVGPDLLFTAFDATATVEAETRLRQFMQTLTETFGQLPIGLAIFDRQRNLVLFNPALTDLTQLPIDTLTARPHLVTFLDTLRERRMMPEPRDYKEWRSSIAELEAAAEAGSYAENWCLADGQTYRVTGRPHPDGAIALLFEDISSEVSLSRRFRSELDLGQAVLDGLDAAVAVFSASGDLTMSNRAYQRLWNDRPDSRVTGTTVTDATRIWSAATAPTPIWGDLRDFVQQDDQREEWIAPIVLNDGRTMTCKVQPLSGGATMVTFDAGHSLPDAIAEPPTALSAV